MDEFQKAFIGAIKEVAHGLKSISASLDALNGDTPQRPSAIEKVGSDAKEGFNNISKSLDKIDLNLQNMS